MTDIHPFPGDGSVQFTATRLGAESIEDLTRMKPFDYTGEPQGDNNARAALAASVLVAFAETGSVQFEDFDTTLGDLLADLRHLCDALELDFADISWRAENNYQSEIRGIEDYAEEAEQTGLQPGESTTGPGPLITMSRTDLDTLALVSADTGASLYQLLSDIFDRREDGDRG